MRAILKDPATGVQVDVDEEFVETFTRAGYTLIKNGDKPDGNPKPVEKMNKEELLAAAAEKGIDVPEGATNKVIIDLLTKPAGDKNPNAPPPDAPPPNAPEDTEEKE